MGNHSRSDEQSDEALMRLLHETQDHAAFSALVRRHALRFRQIAFRHTGNREDAEDIVQQAFLKLWNNPQLWNEQRHVLFSSWFYRVVVNACLDYQRRHKPVPILEGEEFEDSADLQDETLANREQQLQVERAFRSLPADMQTSLNLSFYDPIPNKDAAEMMGLSTKAFQSLLIRAKKALKEKMITQESKKTRRYGHH